MEDIPKTWDAYYDFFKDVQKKLREKRMRNVYGLGLNVTTNGNDPKNVFNYFLIAYGGQDIVTKDGKLHVDDPKVKEAVIKALTYPTTAYKEGFVPPSAINWNDADDNNAFHAKTIVMDLDGTISTEVAVLSQGKRRITTTSSRWAWRSAMTASRCRAGAAYRRPDPEGGKERRGRQGIPQISDPAEGPQRISENRARPATSRACRRSSRTTRGGPPTRTGGLVEQGVLGPTLPQFWVFNPAYAQVQNETRFMTGWMDIILAA